MQQLLEARQIMLSHVCHRWRVVALSTVTLWNNLYVDQYLPPEALKECMTRSKQCSLSIALHSNLSNITNHMLPPDCLPAILRELPRTRLLSLRIPSSELGKDIWSSISSYSLETLELRDGNSREFSVQSVAQFMQMLPRLFPRLKTLQVSDFFFDFKRWTLSSTLTSLDIINKPRSNLHGSEFDPSLVDITNTLRCLPGLRELSWCDPFASMPPLSGVPQSVSLPLLQKLRLCGFTRSHIYLLDHLEFPPLAHAAFEVRVETFAELSQHRSLLLYVPKETHLHTLVVMCGEKSFTHGDYFSVEGWKAESSLNALRYMQRRLYNAPVPEVTLSVQTNQRSSELPVPVSPLHGLLATLPILYASTILLRCSRYNEDAYDMPSTFLRMASVRSLGIACSEGPRVELAIPLRYATRILRHVGDKVVFPELEFLHLECLDFAEGFASFLDVIKRRRDFKKLPKIELWGCVNLRDEMVLALREVVGECEAYRSLTSRSRRLNHHRIEEVEPL